MAGGPLLSVATIRRTTDTFLFISHTTNVLLFKFRCNILIGVRIIKEMPGSVSCGKHCISSNSLEMCTVSCDPWARCRVQTRPPPFCILGRTKPFRVRPSSFKIHFNIIFPLTPKPSSYLLHGEFSAERPYIFVFSILSPTSCPSHGPSFCHHNNIW